MQFNEIYKGSKKDSLQSCFLVYDIAVYSYSIDICRTADSYPEMLTVCCTVSRRLMPDNVDVCENTGDTEEKIRDPGSVQETVSEKNPEISENY